MSCRKCINVNEWYHLNPICFKMAPGAAISILQLLLLLFGLGDLLTPELPILLLFSSYLFTFGLLLPIAYHFQQFTYLSHFHWSIWSQLASQLPPLDFNSCEPWIEISWSRVDFAWCLYWTAFHSFESHSSFAFSSEILLQYSIELKTVNWF